MERTEDSDTSKFKIIFLILFGTSLSTTTIATEIILKNRNLPSKWQECQNCHREKTLEHIPLLKKPSRNHENIQVKHGQKEMSCNFCHNKNNHNFLFSAQEHNDFTHTSTLCHNCHSDVYRKWYGGSHGKRIGGWDDQTQLKVQLNCIDCHNHHNVSFPKMKADPPPKKPQFLIPKELEHK
jgi:hypothetical protein